MDSIWIVEAESDLRAGVEVSAHRSEATATARAVELTDKLLTDAGLTADADPQSWPDRVEALEDATALSTVRLYAVTLEP